MDLLQAIRKAFPHTREHWSPKVQACAKVAMGGQQVQSNQQGQMSDAYTHWTTEAPRSQML